MRVRAGEVVEVVVISLATAAAVFAISRIALLPEALGFFDLALAFGSISTISVGATLLFYAGAKARAARNARMRRMVNSISRELELVPVSAVPWKKRRSVS
jgi:hypothetical protein